MIYRCNINGFYSNLGISSDIFKILDKKFACMSISIKYILISGIPILCTAVTGKLDVPWSLASQSCQTNFWNEAILLTVCLLILFFLVVALHKKRLNVLFWQAQWEEHLQNGYAETSLITVSTTLTYLFKPGCPRTLPTNPFGLLGTKGSSSVGFTMATLLPP